MQNATCDWRSLTRTVNKANTAAIATSIAVRLNNSWCRGSGSQEPFISSVTRHLNESSSPRNCKQRAPSARGPGVNSETHAIRRRVGAAGDEDQKAFWRKGIDRRVSTREFSVVSSRKDNKGWGPLVFPTIA